MLYQRSRSSMALEAASLLVWVGRLKIVSTVLRNEKWLYVMDEVTPPVFAPDPAKMVSTLLPCVLSSSSQVRITRHLSTVQAGELSTAGRLFLSQVSPVLIEQLCMSLH